LLTITHISESELCSRCDIDIPWWWIVGAGEIAAEPGDLDEIMRQCLSFTDWILVFDEPIKQLDFSFGQRKFR